MAWMTSKGWGEYADIVKGPLIRAMHGYVITHQQMTTSSADLHIREALDAAYTQLKASGVHDPELDVPEGEEPKWGQHSFRRQSDRVATATRERSGASTRDIDWFFGWKLKETRDADMQAHYGGLDRMARLVLARVTAWM